jgi:excisionase family DNA binding protein
MNIVECQGAAGTKRLLEVRLASSRREAQPRRSPAAAPRPAIDELLTVEQAAAILQLSPKTLKDWLRAAKLPGCKVDRLWRVKPADLEAFIQASRRWHGAEAHADPRQTR